MPPGFQVKFKVIIKSVMEEDTQVMQVMARCNQVKILVKLKKKQ